ncbi:MAG TPA: MBL fold metallo-hydrolase [Gammaproteobacteria bacterium]|nr:MBL fold metallo-hydrolase [Gammaproteobacteria bacterium]
MQSWQIGDVRVTKVVEMEVAGGSEFILPQATPEAVREMQWMWPHFMDERGRLIMSVHALVIETPGRRIVVDTCIGNDKPRRIPGWNMLQKPFLRDLEQAGYPPPSIDAVLCTHLHVDHVGWNTVWTGERWVPTFPSARYLMASSEFEYWRRQEQDEEQRTVFADSVAPVFDAGLVDLVETDHVLCDEVGLLPTPGHTPAHCSVLIRSRGERALITGDFAHHPCQMARLDWSSTADYDPDAAIRTRREVFERFSDTPTLIIGTHFAGATAGHLVRDGDAYRLVVDG